MSSQTPVLGGPEISRGISVSRSVSAVKGVKFDSESGLGIAS
jgi:hypothetical protein